MIPLFYIITVSVCAAFAVWFFFSHKPRVDAFVALEKIKINHALEAAEHFIETRRDDAQQAFDHAELKVQAEIEVMKRKAQAEIDHLKAKTAQIWFGNPAAPYGTEAVPTITTTGANPAGCPMTDSFTRSMSAQTTLTATPTNVGPSVI